MKVVPADLAAVCRLMRSERRAALAVHVNPDTDAIGAAAGMLDLFAQLGVEASCTRPTTCVCLLRRICCPPAASSASSPKRQRRCMHSIAEA